MGFCLQGGTRPKFQFLGRNSGRSDMGVKTKFQIWEKMFQFLGRNSGRSDLQSATPRARQSDQFQFLGRNSGRSDPAGM